jgi:diguanylate cyclase (GGDEF)-like protein
MAALKNGKIVVNTEMDIVFADEGYLEHTYDSTAKSVFANVHPDDQHLLYEIVEALTTEERASLCCRMCNKDGEYRWISATCSLTPEGDIGVDYHDLTDIENDAKVTERDYLTGLYNRKVITDYVKDLCANHPDTIVNLCIVDIDNFKQINDVYGHSYGDRILKEVSEIILEVLGTDGRAGRIGGDELMMVIENVEEKTDLRVYLKGIRERVEASHKDDSGFPQVTVSMGIGTFPLYVNNYDDLFNLADRMLYRAKNRGKNRYVIYNPDIHGKIVNGELDESSVTINKATAHDKTKLVLESIEGLFDNHNEAIPTLLMKIAATFDLDEVYLYYKDLESSYYGFKRVADSGDATDKNVFKIVDSKKTAEYFMEPNFDSRFNSNGVYVIDTPANQLRLTDKPLQFFTANDIRHAFLYRMLSHGDDCALAFYNTRELSRKFPQQDITDLTYLSKMIEIALKTR